MRVRGFTQDDAHIFCTPETVRGEIVGCIDFAFNVFEVFGFKDIKVELSVRGDDPKCITSVQTRTGNSAEAALVDALNAQADSVRANRRRSSFLRSKDRHSRRRRDWPHLAVDDGAV